MLDTIREPMPWYVAGMLIGLTVPTLLILGNKTFGVSSSLRHICAACSPKIPFFNYNWRAEKWNLFFVFGIALGAFLANTFLANPNAFQLAPQTVQDLQNLGITDFSTLMPTDLFHFEQIFTLKGFVFMVLGGFLVGFGTRYAGGCTSGHAIMGISNLQLPSLIATIFFMIGGFVATHFFLPFLLKL